MIIVLISIMIYEYNRVLVAIIYAAMQMTNVSPILLVDKLVFIYNNTQFFVIIKSFLF